jgi:hypothetical protein
MFSSVAADVLLYRKGIGQYFPDLLYFIFDTAISAKTLLH